MADSGRPTRNYALRGKVKHLCDEYPTLKGLHEALSRGTEEIWGERMPGKNPESRSKPHHEFLQALNKDERLRELDVVFEYVIPGTFRRIDAIVFGEVRREQSENTQRYALVAELKAWKEDSDESQCAYAYDDWAIWNDGRMKAHRRGKEAEYRDHPLFQALSYLNFLRNFHSAGFNGAQWYLESICYLPNIKNRDFLYTGEAEGIRGDGDGFVINNGGDLRRQFGTKGSRSEVMPSDFACDEFLQGTYKIPIQASRWGKAGNIIKNICLMAAGSNADSRNHAFSDMFEQVANRVLDKGLDGAVDNKRWMIVASVQKLLDSKATNDASLFINHADIAISLQCALLQVGCPSVSLQTSATALNSMSETLGTNSLKAGAEKGLETQNTKELKEKLAVGCAFDRIPLQKRSQFNVFNAYKWEPGVFTTIGIVDLCEGARDEAIQLEKPEDAKQSEEQTGSLEEFLENSAGARFIFLLVDDDTKSVKGLKDGEPIQGFTIVKWPTD